MAPNTKSVDQNKNMQVWLCYKKKMTITIKIREGTRAEDRYSSRPEKAYPTGKFIIVAKFGGHVLHHLVSGVANMIRQRGRQTKNLVLVNF